MCRIDQSTASPHFQDAMRHETGRKLHGIPMFVEWSRGMGRRLPVVNINGPLRIIFILRINLEKINMHGVSHWINLVICAWWFVASVDQILISGAIDLCA